MIYTLHRLRYTGVSHQQRQEQQQQYKKSNTNNHWEYAMMHLCLINLQKNIMYILPVLSSKCLMSLILQQSTLVWITWCPATKSPLPHSKAQLPHMSALETKGGRAIAIVGRLRLRYRLTNAQYIHCRLHQ